MTEGNVAPTTVLLVDDDPDLLELGRTVLETDSVRVVTSPDGRRALQMLDLVEPDVIVLDMMMPELDGLGFLREYAARPLPRAPVIAVSSFSPYLDEARDFGAASVLRKPYDPAQLRTVVREIVGGNRPDGVSSDVPREDERARLRAMVELRVDQPALEPGMQRFLDEVASTFGVPIAGISAVTADRQQLVTHCTMLERDDGGPREQAFCTHAVAARAALVIQDALENPFFRDNPSVTVRGFRFYAGVPLIAAQGEAVGTLCILDYKPHSFTHYDLEILSLFARRVLAVLDARHKQAHPDTPDSVYRNLQQHDETLDIYGKSLFEDLVVVEAARSLVRGERSSLVVVQLPADRLASSVDALRDAVDGGLLGRLDTSRIGVIVRGQGAHDAESIVRRVCGDGALVASTDLDRYPGGASGMALVHLEQTVAELANQ